MTYQQMSFIEEQELRGGDSLAFQGASLASRIRLQDCVKHLVMNVICGRSTGESLAKLDQSGLWLRMYGDYCQAKMDGSFEEFSGTLPIWGMMLDGVVTELPMSEQFIPEKGSALLPTLVASDCGPAAIIGKNDTFKKNKSGTLRKVNQNGTDGSLGLTRTLRLLPTMTANDWKGCARNRHIGSKNNHCSNPLEKLRNGPDDPIYLNPNFCEIIMGFPITWTELKHSEIV
jgi:hypothetical protein